MLSQHTLTPARTHHTSTCTQTHTYLVVEAHDASVSGKGLLVYLVLGHGEAQSVHGLARLPQRRAEQVNDSSHLDLLLCFGYCCSLREGLLLFDHVEPYCYSRVSKKAANTERDAAARPAARPKKVRGWKWKGALGGLATSL